MKLTDLYIKEDSEKDENWPKQIGKAAEFTVEVDENEQVSILDKNQVKLTMPYVIWKQLIR